MYITDATHFLDAKGAIGPPSWPGRKLAEFFGSVIVAATLPDATASPPLCMKCAGLIEAAVVVTDEIRWQCSACTEAGQISNWRHTLWDMSTTGSAQRA